MMRISIVLLSAVFTFCSSIQPASKPQHLTAVTPAVSTDPADNYVLKTIDGKALPTRPNDPDRPASAGPGPLVVGGSLVISPGGEARYVLNFRGPQGRENAIRMTASFLRDGDRPVLVWPNGARTPLTFQGRTLTLDNLGMKMAFERAR